MATTSFRLDGATALVTGAASGIGARIALGLAEFGARVGCLDVSEDGLRATVEAIAAADGEALALAADVTDAARLEDAVQRLQERFGPLRHAVNCAGIHSNAPAEEMPPETWNAVVDTNLTGVFLSCQAEGRAMLAHGGGTM